MANQVTDRVIPREPCHVKGDCANCPFDFPMSYDFRRHYCLFECGMELPELEGETNETANDS